MQHHGWLKKRSSGKIKSWRRFTLRVFYTLHSSFSLSFLLVHSSVRRYVLVDSTASLYYFDHECTSIENKNKIKGTRHLTSFFANVGALQNNLPKSSDVDRAFMFVTSDSRKPMMLVVADTIEEKNKWIEFLTDLFMREKLFDLQFLRESMFCNPSRQISSQLHYFPNQSTPFTIRRVNFPVNIFVMICLFVGDVHEAVSMKFVCRGWNACWKLFEPKILHWLVRFGQVEAGYRWKFWCHQLNITHGIDKASFARLIEQSTEFNQYEITKDVNRAFGTSTGKRMIERR